MTTSQRLVVLSVDGAIEFYKFNAVANMVSLVGRLTGTRLFHCTPFCCR